MTNDTPEGIKLSKEMRIFEVPLGTYVTTPELRNFDRAVHITKPSGGYIVSDFSKGNREDGKTKYEWMNEKAKDIVEVVEVPLPEVVDQYELRELDRVTAEAREGLPTVTREKVGYEYDFNRRQYAELLGDRPDNPYLSA